MTDQHPGCDRAESIRSSRSRPRSPKPPWKRKPGRRRKTSPILSMSNSPVAAERQGNEDCLTTAPAGVGSEEDRDKIEDEARRAPSVGAEFLNLDRDYEVVKKNYTELLARRESAQIAENADRKGDKIDIKTIDTPEVPTLPSSPNRPAVPVDGSRSPVLARGSAWPSCSARSIAPTARQPRCRPLGLPILGSISVINSFDRRPKHWFLSAKAFAAAVRDARRYLWRFIAGLYRPAP